MDFEMVFREYFKDVFLYVRSLSAEEGLAEEITQETFVKALKAIDAFDGKKDIRAWLFAIARNTYYSYLRQQKKLADYPPDYTKQFEQTDFTMRFVDEERAFLVHQFLHSMKEPYKEVFNLRVFGELSFEKIGKIFGKSAGWARVTYYRAKKQMVDYMEVIEHEDTAL
ncbi:MAG: sigma-70 family RNA polymerase sigma factor [Peptococcaceae bacterium]|nr:sigma-70 family RNA polymerase sigma factor [Peptococcaceae bacterium]